MLDSLVNKVTGLEDCNLNWKKETPTHVLFCECCEIFKNTYYEDICEQLLLNIEEEKVWQGVLI